MHLGDQCCCPCWWAKLKWTSLGFLALRKFWTLEVGAFCDTAGTNPLSLSWYHGNGIRAAVRNRVWHRCLLFDVILDSNYHKKPFALVFGIFIISHECLDCPYISLLSWRRRDTGYVAQAVRTASCCLSQQLAVIVAPTMRRDRVLTLQSECHG